MDENMSLELRLKDLEISNAQLRVDVKSRSETAQLRAGAISKSFEHATWESDMTEERNLGIINLDQSISSCYGEGKSKVVNDEAIPKGKIKTKEKLKNNLNRTRYNEREDKRNENKKRTSREKHH